MRRYLKNMNMLSKEENSSLKNFKVCVVGCGGLGGFVIEMLGRLGIGNITVIDGDVFDETNLNRQLLSNCENLGKEKVLVAKERMKVINPDVTLNAIIGLITEENGLDILKGHDVIVDAVDNIQTRLVIESVASKLDIPMVYGAISGWYGQVSTIFPKDNTFKKIYPKNYNPEIENQLGNPSFTPALVASIQVSEILKILIGRGELLRNKILYIDTYEQSYTVLDI